MSEQASISRFPIEAESGALTRLEDFAPPAEPILAFLRGVSTTHAKQVELCRTLRHDPQLASLVLETSNYEEIESAVERLGCEAVANRMLAIQLPIAFGQAPTHNGEPRFDWSGFWRHSLAVATAARAIAKARIELRVQPESAFLAGFIHDLGKVALAKLFPRGFVRAISFARQNRCDLQTAESAVLGITHTLAGRRVAERWDLPEALRETIWLHHYAHAGAIASTQARELVRIVYAANRLAHARSIGDSGNAERAVELRDLAVDVNIPVADLELAAAEAAQQPVPSPRKSAIPLRTENAAPPRSLLALETENDRLKTISRYFTVLGRLDQDLSGHSNTRDVLRAVISAVGGLWPAKVVGVFAVSETSQSIRLARVDEKREIQHEEFALKDQLRAILAPAIKLSSLFETLPREIRLLLGPIPIDESETAWFARISRGNVLLGGLVVGAAARFPEDMAGEQNECEALLNRIGLCLSRADAQATTQRLADELADSNRRLQASQAEMLRSRSLSMIAELAAGAGHELNNPLSVISGRAQLLLRDVPSDSEAYRSLEQILAKSHECSRIVSDLMDFARPRPPVVETLTVGELLSAVSDQSQGRLPSNIRLEFHNSVVSAARESLTIRGDRQQLIQAFEELIRNAADALEINGGCIRVSARVAARPQFQTAITDSYSQGVEFTVSDNGGGMPPSILQRVFDPFFSHRPAGRRRGLGLTRVHRILETHGGRVWIESRVGEGTHAHMFLPFSK